ncbi:hypothetical protein KKF86_05650 [bacterium]|nr:hypothetical protein [bacterium]
MEKRRNDEGEIIAVAVYAPCITINDYPMITYTKYLTSDLLPFFNLQS